MSKQKVTRNFTYKRKYHPSTPFSSWLRSYSEENNIPMAVMSLEAGLSRGILNNFIQYPERRPNLKTILRLSAYTGKPADEIAELAGVAGYKPNYRPVGNADPAIEELVKVYKRLPTPMQHYVLRSVYGLDEALKALKPDSSQDK